MNELTEKVQQAHDRGGWEEARQAFIDGCQERNWTREELDEVVALLRSLP